MAGWHGGKCSQCTRARIHTCRDLLPSCKLYHRLSASRAYGNDGEVNSHINGEFYPINRTLREGLTSKLSSYKEYTTPTLHKRLLESCPSFVSHLDPPSPHLLRKSFDGFCPNLFSGQNDIFILQPRFPHLILHSQSIDRQWIKRDNPSITQ